MNPVLEDSRRLTGPNLFWDRPGAIIDISLGDIPPPRVLELWRNAARRFLDAVGWARQDITTRVHDVGASLVLSAPLDALYAATELNEAAWEQCLAELNGEPGLDFDQQTKRLQALIRDEQNPRLLNLQAAAQAHGCRFLTDDDEVSIGYGPGSETFPVTAIPDPASIDWRRISSIPLALVTGTNGKSTSVRLAAAVFAAAGKTCGVTSTDYIRVGEEIIDQGDYSGPGGARTLLRDHRVEAAVLEVARGGLLRRGLGVNEADAVLITNVAADHLGEYGINTVPELIEAKFIVRRALRPEQPLILNADDSGVVDFACSMDQRIVWFSEDPSNPVITAHQSVDGEAVVVRDGHLIWLKGDAAENLLSVRNIPITFDGSARHNVQNAMGVAALCKVLGVSNQAIISGLKGFSGSPEENPGRGNLFEVQGIRVLVDFAHNEHGMKSVASTLANMSCKRRLVLMGQAGDRSDELIRDLVRAALKADPDQLVVCDLPGYERGRQAGEVAGLIQEFAMEMGMRSNQIIHAAGPAEGTKLALEWARPGDCLLLLTLTEREASINVVRQFGTA